MIFTDYLWMIVFIVVLMFMGFALGFTIGDAQSVTIEECQRSTKSGLDITDYDPAIIDSKLAACELLYKE